MPGTLFLNFFLSTVTFNLQHLELLSYTQIESYSFFSSMYCTELLLLKTGHHSVKALSCMFSIKSQSVRYHSETAYYLERLFFFLIRKRKCLTHLSQVTFVEQVLPTEIICCPAMCLVCSRWHYRTEKQDKRHLLSLQFAKIHKCEMYTFPARKKKWCSAPASDRQACIPACYFVFSMAT